MKLLTQAEAGRIFFFGANTQNCWSCFFVGGLTLIDPMFHLPLINQVDV